MIAALCLLLLGVSLSSASECESVYHGHCINFLFGSCPNGYMLSFSHCDFMQSCCYPARYTPSGSNPSGSSSGSHTTGTPSGGHTSAPSTGHVAPSGSCGISTVNDHHRIVGGSIATPAEYPWQVSLRYNGQHMCGGTLIHEQWVLTAAHCFEHTHSSGWTAALGVHDRRVIYSSQVHRASHIYRHSQYNSRSNSNDIALMKLDRPVDTSSSSVRKACLPDASESFDSMLCTVTGWGATHTDGPGQRYLHEVDVPILTNSVCSYYLGRSIHDQNVCAGFSQGGKDACQGDSGGPLVCKHGNQWKITGIVSWGYGCGDRYAPGVYTRVTHFLSWINSVISKH